MAKVIILGGGVAGLSAAHELVERGFEVEVYEKSAVVGGKARSVTKPKSGTGGRQDLPGEHGFRFFPGFYQHVTDTMQRIPFGNNVNGVLDNLVLATEATIAQEQKPFYTFLTHVPKTIQDWIVVLNDWFARAELGISAADGAFFVERLFDILSMCNDRRLAELETAKWWDFVDAPNRSIAYRKLLATGLTRSLVAMPAEIANTRTVGTILIQLLLSLGSQFDNLDRVLNGPTSVVWIAPWENYLNQKGVKIFKNSAVNKFDFDGTNITGVVINQAAGPTTVQGDYYLLAVPVEVAKGFFSAAMKAKAPSLANVDQLEVLWMNGIQFYLNRNVIGCHGHMILSDSHWALTCIAQPQFWSGTNLSQYGNGQVAGLISVDISDWFTPGNKTTTKSASQCSSAEEVMNECWAQLVAHFSASADPLTNADRVDWYLDPDITFPVPVGGPVGDNEPLLVNTVGSWANRPDAVTGIGNLFLASDYVRTNTNLATMEGANEAARRAVNGVLTKAGSSAQPCMVWDLREPAVFDPAKALDQFLFDHGLPHPGFTAMKPLLRIV
jgi:uncharacterized protein with NAD-binding domain and iron-sulfur cluster